jgi:hypothetical protein
MDNNDDATDIVTISHLRKKIPRLFRKLPICDSKTFPIFVQGLFSSTISFNEKEPSGVGLNHCTPSNSDGTLATFKDRSSILSAIQVLFDLIGRVLTSATPADLAQIGQLHGILARVYNDTLSVGNINEATIDAQVMFYNICFEEYGDAHRDPKYGLENLDIATLLPQYQNQAALAFSKSPDMVKAWVADMKAFPNNVDAQVGAVPEESSKAKKRRLDREKSAATKAANKKANLNPSTTTLNNSNTSATVATPSNSIHCVNEAALLMKSQWPANATPPSGCNPTNGKTCTRTHTMPILPGQTIGKDLVKDLLNGLGGFKKNPNFQKNFTQTIKAWK